MREFKLMQSGHMKMEQDRIVQQWDFVRTLGTFVLQPHLKKGKKLKPSDLIPLPKDKKSKKEESVENRREKAEFALAKRELIKKKKSENDQSRKTTLPS